MVSYITINKRELINNLGLINEFSVKFPLLKSSEINYEELAKYYKVHPIKLKAAVGLLDAMRHINRVEGKSLAFDVEDLVKIKAKKQGQEWTFILYRTSNEKLKIKHEIN